MGCGASVKSGGVFDFEEFIQRYDKLTAFQARFSETSKVKIIIRDDTAAQVLKLPKESGCMWMLSTPKLLVSLALVRRDCCCISVPGLANLTSSCYN